MNERTIIKGVVGVLVTILLFAIGNTDIIYVGCSVLFFALCAAYAVWCEWL